MKIVIIGYGPGGAAAAIAARMFNSDAEIKIVTDETIEAHRKPGASLAIEHPEFDSSIRSDPDERPPVSRIICKPLLTSQFIEVVLAADAL